MYHIKYKNQGKIERTGKIESFREAIESAEFLRLQGTKSIKIINQSKNKFSLKQAALSNEEGE